MKKKILRISLLGLLSFAVFTGTGFAQNVFADPVISGMSHDDPDFTDGSAICTVTMGNASNAGTLDDILAGSVQWNFSWPAFVSVDALIDFDGGPFVETGRTVDMTGTFIQIQTNGTIPRNTIFNVKFTVIGIAISAGQEASTGNVSVLNPGITGNTNPGNDNVSEDIQTLAILPIKLSEFSALSRDCSTAELNWKTTQERDANSFVVERAKAGSSSFESITTIKASNSSDAEKKYTYTDKNIANGNYIYRLKQVDVNGKYEYSASVAVTVSCKGAITIHPNPVLGKVYISASDYKGTVRVTSTSGAEIFRATAVPREIDASKWPSGVYFITIDNGESRMFKILKQ